MKSISCHALAAAKARGVQLGSSRPGHWEGREDDRRAWALKGSLAARVKRSEEAVEAYADLIPVMTEMKTAGKSLRAIAEALNQQGHTTGRGIAWNQVQVKRVLDRCEK